MGGMDGWDVCEMVAKMSQAVKLSRVIGLGGIWSKGVSGPCLTILGGGFGGRN